MRDIVRSLADQVAGLKGIVAQRQAEISQAKSAIESSAEEAENLRIIFERAKQLRAEGINSQADFDNKSTAYQVALVRLSEAKGKMSQTIAALAQAERSRT